MGYTVQGGGTEEGTLNSHASQNNFLFDFPPIHWVAGTARYPRKTPPATTVSHVYDNRTGH